MSDLVLAKCCTLTEVAPTMAGRPVASPRRVSSPWLAPMPAPAHAVQCISTAWLVFHVAVQTTGPAQGSCLMIETCLSLVDGHSCVSCNILTATEEPACCHKCITNWTCICCKYALGLCTCCAVWCPTWSACDLMQQRQDWQCLQGLCHSEAVHVEGEVAGSQEAHKGHASA